MTSEMVTMDASAAGAQSHDARRRVVVVGGGLAGITAALDCAQAGACVTLIEARGRLGGAAYSFERGGVTPDNGQHVFLRCNTAYRDLLERIGAAELVTIQPYLDLNVVAPGGCSGRLSRSALPAPLHMAASLLRCPFLSWRERLAVIWAMQALGRVDVDDPANDEVAFGQWLARHRQSRAAVESIWDLIIRPTLNLTVDECSLAQVAMVFQLGLLGDADAGDIGWAAVPLSEIHDRAARRALERAGVEVRTGTTVKLIVAGRHDAADHAIDGDGGDDGDAGDRDGGRSFRVDASDGRSDAADAVVVAVGPPRAAALLPRAAGIDPQFAERLGASPIVNLHIVFDRRVMQAPFIAGVGSPVQFVFDRTDSGYRGAPDTPARPNPATPAGPGSGTATPAGPGSGTATPAGSGSAQYLTVTLSAADAELHTPAEQLRERYLPALAALLPAVGTATVLDFFVTREHAATFRAAPGARAWRPGSRTALPGLVLAGAFTDTGWPATMEGAVRSGHSAAQELLDQLRIAPRESEGLMILAPMGIEARAIRAGARWADVHTVGMGPKRAAAFARSIQDYGNRPILVAGCCGALDPQLQPGDVVLASELISTEGSVTLEDPSALAEVLRRGGLTVHVAPIACSATLVTGERRAELLAEGAVAAEMESTWLLPQDRGQPFTVLRVVLDTGERELLHPLHTTTGAVITYRALRRACSLLAEWVREPVSK